MGNPAILPADLAAPGVATSPTGIAAPPLRRHAAGGRGFPGLKRALGAAADPTQRAAAVAFVIRVVSAGVNFVSQIVLARWLGDYEFGLFVGVWTWLLLAGDTLHLGMPLVAQRFIPEYRHAGRADRLRGFLAGSCWITFAIASAFALLGAAAISLAGSWTPVAVVLPFYLACASLPFYALSLMCDGLARSHNWMTLALAPHSLLRPALLFLLMAIAGAIGIPLDATTTMAALTVAIWSTSLLQLALVRRGLAAVVPAGPRSYETGRWFATAFPVFLVWSCYVGLSYADVLVLQWTRPAEDVAHYYAALKTMLLVGFIHFSVAAAVGHRFTAFHVAGRSAELATFVAATVRWTFWPSLGATLLMLALGWPLLSLFGPDFATAYPVMFVLAVGLLARAAIGPAERLLSMLGQQRICAAAYAAAFLFNVAACAILAPWLGPAGAAAATSAAIVLESILLSRAARTRLGLRLFIGAPAATAGATT